MALLGTLVISLATIIACAVLSAYINVSRERLWLRATKAEELFGLVEATYLTLVTKVSAALDLPSSNFVHSNDLDDVVQKLSGIKVCVALYFPEASRELACVEGTSKSLASVLIKIRDPRNRANQTALLNDLDSQICSLATALNALKQRVLAEASIKENWFGLTLRRQPVRRPNSQMRLELTNASF